jgi:hypothetical protein
MTYRIPKERIVELMKSGGQNGAFFDPNEVNFRYALWRLFKEPDDFENMKIVSFIGLNPSTADEVKNDPTVTRCVNFAKSWDFDGMFMLNLFAYRATEPKELKATYEANKYRLGVVGYFTDEWILSVCDLSNMVIACWGGNGTYLSRDKEVLFMLENECEKEVYALGKTKEKHPRHPLYLKRSSKPEKYVK